MFWEQGLIQLQKILKKLLTEPTDPQYTEFENSNFTIDFKWSNFKNTKHHFP
jgi:hypothetical protein